MGLFSSKPLSHFPVVKGRRLDGTAVRFPHDLPADATLLIVAFQDDLDPLSDQWARLGERVAEAHAGRVATVEAPVVNRALKFMGDFATMGLRGQVESEAERARTVPLFVDVKPFRKKLKVKTGDVTAFLLARDGRIAWRGEGDIDMDEVRELEAAVAEVLAAPVPPLTDHPDIDDPDEDTDDVDTEAALDGEDSTVDDTEAALDGEGDADDVDADAASHHDDADVPADDRPEAGTGTA